ncbi:MAG: glycosyltransferase [Actinomycetota bacterium]|nr:glycosyltransferase [Actinomycetota bacterium]
MFRSLFGPGDQSVLTSCGCFSAKAGEMVEDLPLRAQEELVRASGGDSPALWRLLAEAGYDVVVFARNTAASTVFGVHHVDRRTRVVLLPLAQHGLLLGMSVLDYLWGRVDSVVVTTETERATMERHLMGAAPVWNSGFVLRVNPLALAAAPHGYVESQRNLVVAGDWRESKEHGWAERWSRILRAELGDDIRLRVVGPGAMNVLREGGERLTSSRLDVWRWVSRAVAVIDPGTHRLLGRDVLEAMMFGTPVVVSAHGGASREHAQVGNGGLWYRTEPELLACAEALLDPDFRRGLSDQGRSYAANGYADTDRYVSSVVKAVLEEE